MTKPKTPTTLKGEWTTIEMNGLKYTVWCMPPEPVEPTCNRVEAFLYIADNLKSRMLTNDKSPEYSKRAVQEWLDKFPKPIK